MIFTRKGYFYDEQGRQVILHGVNLVNKDAKSRYTGEVSAEDFQKMRSWGFNCVRLGVIWDGLEPQPGQIDADYLKALDQRVGWAVDAGLYVILDMHQDLYSVLYSDGAPEWATLTDGKEHISAGEVWSDAYFTSPAVQTALDNFWRNASAPDGVGLQDHYARVWEVLARRFASLSQVIGLDLMNEPFPGSMAVDAQNLLFVHGAELLVKLGEISHARGEPPTGEDLANRWLDPQGRFEILQLLRDKNLFAQVIDVTEPIYAQFEKTLLMPLYRRISRAVRSVSSRYLFFLETSMGSNMGVRSAIEPLLDQDNDLPDPQQAYAPHGYDLVVDTPNIALASSERIELIFARHAETSQRLGLPMLVGEWGAFPRDIPGTLPAAWNVAHQFENYLCGDTYWHYEADLNTLPPFQAISRPYPERVNGSLEWYRYDEAKKEFSCSWVENPDVAAPSVVYIPNWIGLEVGSIQLAPLGEGLDVRIDNSGAWLTIYPFEQGGTRVLSVKACGNKAR